MEKNWYPSSDYTNNWVKRKHLVKHMMNIMPFQPTSVPPKLQPEFVQNTIFAFVAARIRAQFICVKCNMQKR
jgi:hypothetical protein